MAKLKMSSRTVRCVHREAEASMIATQLLLAQGALAMPEAKGKDEAAVCSPRQVLREIRREILGGVSPQRRRHFEIRLRECRRERRVRSLRKATGDRNR